MNKIVRFNSEGEFIAYRKRKTFKKLGAGSEGACYQGKDGLVYKDFTEGINVADYDLDKIVTNSDVQNDSFAFPQVLFAVGNNIVGLTSELVSPDYLYFNYMIDNGVGHIDFDQLYKAYRVMKRNVAKLANDGVSIYDLSYNLMFDGERLVGVDTCGYTKTSEVSVEHNVACLDDAIKNVFLMYGRLIQDVELDTSLDVLSFLKSAKKSLCTHKEDSRTQYFIQ